jgi:hypothetical protein
MKVYIGQVFYIDVDDTLIDHHNQPKQHVVDFCHYARERGAVLYLWSQGGAGYCREIADKLGLIYLFTAFLSKPDVVVDDLEIKATFVTHIHPIQLVGVNWPYKLDKESDCAAKTKTKT